MVEKITSTVQPLARIGDGVLGDGDGGDHSHHDPEDPLGWLRDSIPGRRKGEGGLIALAFWKTSSSSVNFDFCDPKT